MDAYDIRSVFNPNTACDYCHEKKIRCDKLKPQCTKCSEKNIECTYGMRYKRGPKRPKEILPTRGIKNKDQIKVRKSKARMQAMQFELEFNKKMSELWQIMLTQNNARRPPPTFKPETEQFIRSAQAVTFLMEEFNSTSRLIYIDTYNFATNPDFASNIWQAVIQINFADLLSLFNEFKTSLLLSILEYLVLFALGLKMNYYDDISEYIIRMAHSIVNTVVYARDGTDDSLTPELTLQLNISLALIVTYYRISVNLFAAKTTSLLIFELYEQNKHHRTFNKDHEARMCIRKLLHVDSRAEQDRYLDRLRELTEEGIMTPSLQYYLNYHLSFARLASHEDLISAENCIQKAEYFINWHVDQSPLELQDLVRDLFDCKLNVVHAEIAMRLGDVDLAKKKVGGFIQLYARVPPPARRLITHLLGFASYAYRQHQLTWSFDYYSLLNADVAMDHRALPLGTTNNELLAYNNAASSYQDDDNTEQQLALSDQIRMGFDSSILDVDYDLIASIVADTL